MAKWLNAWKNNCVEEVKESNLMNQSRNPSMNVLKNTN